MKKATLAGLMLMCIALSAEAVNLHRWPLDYYAAPAYSRWFDGDDIVGNTRRYDGATNRPAEDQHHGTDILGNVSPTYIRAGAPGNLYYSFNSCSNNGYPGNTCGSGYGNHVRIQHPDGKVTIYAHMLQGVLGLSSVLCGANVGSMGNSGDSSGTHLHLEMWSSTSIGTRMDHFGGPGNWYNASYWVNQGGTTVPVYPSTACQ